MFCENRINVDFDVNIVDMKNFWNGKKFNMLEDKKDN